MAYAMANLNSLNDHTYFSPSKTGCYTNPQPTTSTPAYSAQYLPPPIPPPFMMTNAQQGFAHYQQPPPQTDIGKMLSEVLNRIRDLDEKLVRLDYIDKKLSKLDTISADLCKLYTNYFIMILLSIYIYNWIGNKFLQLTSPSPYKYINSINKANLLMLMV